MMHACGVDGTAGAKSSRRPMDHWVGGRVTKRCAWRSLLFHAAVDLRLMYCGPAQYPHEHAASFGMRR